MKLYKIRAWANSRVKRGYDKGRIIHPHSFETVVVNLETAKRIYKEQKETVANMHTYASVESVRAELFIPHIHDNGELAYWPDNEKYIELYNPDNL